MADDLVNINRGRRAGPWPMLDIHREINRLFEDFFEAGPLGWPGSAGMQPLIRAPRLDIHESQGELCIIAELPGVMQSDIDLSLDGDMLTIRGEKKQEQEQENEQATYHMVERRYGRFERSVQLPFAPDPGQVNAKFDNGVLRIRLPRQGEQQRAHHIEVQSGSGTQTQDSTAASDQDRRQGRQGSMQGSASKP